MSACNQICDLSSTVVEAKRLLEMSVSHVQPAEAVMQTEMCFGCAGLALQAHFMPRVAWHMWSEMVLMATSTLNELRLMAFRHSEHVYVVVVCKHDEVEAAAALQVHDVTGPLQDSVEMRQMQGTNQTEL